MTGGVFPGTTGDRGAMRLVYVVDLAAVARGAWVGSGGARGYRVRVVSVRPRALRSLCHLVSRPPAGRYSSTPLQGMAAQLQLNGPSLKNVWLVAGWILVRAQLAALSRLVLGPTKRCNLSQKPSST